MTSKAIIFSSLLPAILHLVCGSCLEPFIGDSYCDDQNNIEACDFDGGLYRVLFVVLLILSLTIHKV